MRPPRPRTGVASIALAWGALAAHVVPAQAAEAPPPLHVTAIAPGYPGRPADDARWLIYLDGPVDPGATSRVVGLVLQEQITTATVYLNSPGGSLLTAMQLGRVLREHGFDAAVGARTNDPASVGPGTCDSACPFLLAGGAHRSAAPGSSLGVHRARNRIPVPNEAAFEARVAADVAAYLDEMGVDRRLGQLMAETPHERIHLIDHQEALRLRLISPEAAGDQPRAVN